MSSISKLHMSPRDIQLEVRKLEVLVGPRAEVFVTVNAAGRPISISVYANGLTKGNTFRVEADDWAEGFAMAAEKWAECGERVEAEMIEKMALAIIAITSRKGACLDADIRGADFSQADLSRYGERACQKANEMAAGGPFAITMGQKANAA